MTKLKYKLTLILLVGLSITLHATEPTFKKDFTREVHESFDVSPGVNLGIQNKYGDIKITTWDKNKVQIDVLIKVMANNSEKGKDFLDGIEIDFSSSSSKVNAKTVYPDQDNNSWWSGWFNNSKNIDYEVHYSIKAPKRVSTILTNKYGDIFQESIDGDSDVTNKYGNINYENVSGNLDLNLGYGKAIIGEVANSKMQIKYSSLRLAKAQNLDISTKYSKVKIKQCNSIESYTKYDEYVVESLGTLNNQGKYDEFTIGSIDAISIKTKYTEINIKTLNHKANFETKYGDVQIESTGTGLEEINIDSKYTGFNFSIVGNYHLAFEGAHTSLKLDQPYEKYQSEKDGSDLKLKAFRGSKEGGAKINAIMSYGRLKIY